MCIYIREKIYSQTSRWQQELQFQASRELRSLDWLRIDQQFSVEKIFTGPACAHAICTRTLLVYQNCLRLLVYFFAYETAALENTEEPQVTLKFISILLSSGPIEIPKSYNKVDTITKYTKRWRVKLIDFKSRLRDTHFEFFGFLVFRNGIIFQD